MSSLSKLAVCRALIISLAITLGVFGVQALQAKGQRCVPQTPTCQVVDKHAQHEAEKARERELKALKEQQKDDERAQHEAAKIAAEQQKAREKAQHEAEEECARQQKAYEHAQHEAAEDRERAEAKQAECNRCAPACPAETAPACPAVTAPACPPVTMVEPAPEPFPEGLPKTASPMGLIGLVGAMSLTGFGMRFRR